MAHIIKSVDHPNQKYKPGDVIFQEKSAADCFYIIKKGSVSVYKNYQQPDKIHLATIDAGKVLGEISGIDGLPRTATAVAESEVEVARVSAETLHYQLKQCPGWFRAIILDLVERLRHTDELLIKTGVTHSGIQSSMKTTSEKE